MSLSIKTSPVVAAAALTAVFATSVAHAAPPPWAPAHGYRAKHDRHYTGYAGYTGYRWDRDYGISRGRCNRDDVGTVVGAVLGGAVGSRVGSGDRKVISILVGAAIGALIGREIGRDMNDSDRACMGHALEIGQMGQPIYWDGPQPGLGYTMTVHDGFRQDGYSCRNFTLERDYAGERMSQRSAACRYGDGEWRLVQR
jgi:surface antigen